jgi:hypothetical protein
MVEHKKDIIKSIFVYFFAALGIIFTIMGVYGSINTFVFGSTDSFRSKLQMESNCDYVIEPAIGMPKFATGEAKVDMKEEKEKCIKRNKLQYEEQSKRDMVNSAFFLVVGLGLSVYFLQEAKKV